MMLRIMQCNVIWHSCAFVATYIYTCSQPVTHSLKSKFSHPFHSAWVLLVVEEEDGLVLDKEKGKELGKMGWDRLLSHRSEIHGGFKGGVCSSYYAELLSIAADSHPDHDLMDVRFFSCSPSISLRRCFSPSPLKTISIERSYSLIRSMALRSKLFATSRYSLLKVLPKMPTSSVYNDLLAFFA